MNNDSREHGKETHEHTARKNHGEEFSELEEMTSGKYG